MEFELEFINKELTLTNADLYPEYNYLQKVNLSDTYLTVGGASSQQFVFSTRDATLATGDSFILRIHFNSDGETFRTMGIFNVYSIEQREEWYYVTSWDNMIKFETDASYFMDNLTYPITLGELFVQLCSTVGLEPDNPTFFNNTITIENKAAVVYGASARQLLRYIAAAAGGYARCSYQGKVQILNYLDLTEEPALTNNNYRVSNRDTYTTPPISKVTINYLDNDLGVSYGDGDEELIITYNPFLYNTTSSVMQSYAQSILEKLEDIEYKGGIIELFDDFGYNAGDIILIDDSPFVIMEKTFNEQGVKFYSYGVDTRKDKDIIETDFNAYMLQNKYNTFERTLDGTISTVGEIQTQQGYLQENFTALSQTANQLQIQVQQNQQRLDNIGEMVDENAMWYDFTNEGLYLYGGNKSDPEVYKYKLHLSPQQIAFLYNEIARLVITTEGLNAPGQIKAGNEDGEGSFALTDNTKNYTFTINSGKMTIGRGFEGVE